MVVPDDVAHPHEEDHRAAVVEQRLALNERAKVLGGAEVLEQSDDRDGVGGGRDDPDEPCSDEGSKRVSSSSDHLLV